MADDERAWQIAPRIVLGNKGIQNQTRHLLRAGYHFFIALRQVHPIFYMGRKISSVAQMAPTAHHGQVHTGAATLHLHGQDVDVFFAQGLDRLLRQNRRDRANLVAQQRRLFKL